MAAGFQPAEEFWFFVVERAEPRGPRLWVWGRCEPIDRSFAASVGGAESVSIGALGAEPVGVRSAALLGGFSTESNWTVREPANSKRKHSTIVPKRQHAAIEPERELTPIVGGQRRQPFGIVTKLQSAEFIGLINSKCLQWRRRRRFFNPRSQLSWINESRGRRWRQRWRWPPLSYSK